VGPLEQAVCDHLGWVLQRKDPERGWRIERGRGDHAGSTSTRNLSEVDALVQGESPSLRVMVGTDYLIRPDVTVSLARGADRVRASPRLHAGGVVQVDDPLGPGCRTSGTSACR